MPQSQSALMETAELERLLQQPNIKVLDASYHVPPSPRQAQVEYEQSHIPGALFFDIDQIAEPASALPHMLPSADAFERHMLNLGIGSQDTIVIYDVHGMMSAPRAWWMFRYFGHNRVYVLNGGLPKWLAENRPMQTGAVAVSNPSAPFKAQVNPQLLAQLERMQAAVHALEAEGKAPFQIVDMRPAGRFTGENPEPRPGLKQGHIPGSINAPWSSWLNPDHTLLSTTDLQARCKAIGLDWRSPAVMTCGSGITACVGALALYELGHAACPVYDGSWAEWGALPDAPIACSTGCA